MSSGPRTAESENGKMSAGNRGNEESGEVSARKAQKRSRVREVDFMRVEDTAHGQALHPFELEVKEKIASQSSPFDELMRREMDRENRRVEKIARGKLRKLLKAGVLTPKQKICYELLYEKSLSTGDVARKMDISKSRVRDLRRAIQKALARAYEKHMEDILIWRLGYPFCKTKRQRFVWRLRYLEGFTPAQIALREDRAKSSVNEVIERVKKNILNGKTLSDLRHPPLFLPKTTGGEANPKKSE